MIGLLHVGDAAIRSHALPEPDGTTTSARADLRFVVDPTGAVVRASATGALPTGVPSCLSSALHGLSFPSPDGGIATVSYSLLLGD